MKHFLPILLLFLSLASTLSALAGEKSAPISSRYICRDSLLPAHSAQQETTPYDSLLSSIDEELLGTVVVTARKPKSRATTVAVRLSREELLVKGAPSVADLLKTVPGVSTISSGANISKPVIQGMYSSRILLINNGVRQQGQQWGADHAPEVDASGVQEAEVIKGAESIRYGSGAIGGVILLNTVPLPAGAQMQGRARLRGAVNDLATSLLMDLAGGADRAGWEPFRYHVQLTGQVSRDYRTARYVLNNTAARTAALNAALGWRTEPYSLELFLSGYTTELGVFSGSHVGTLDDLLERFRAGRPSNVYPPSFTIIAPKQQVHHLIMRLSGVYRLPGGGKMNAQYDFQADVRNEYEQRPGSFAAKPSLGLNLLTHSGHFSWASSADKPLRFIVGSDVEGQQNWSRNDTGAVPLIPNFALLGAGVYAVGQWHRPLYQVELGGRYDYRYLNAHGYDYLGNSYGGVHHFQSPSLSLSGAYFPTDGVELSSNLGLAWRAPEVNELYSSGLHHGVAAYEVGDPALRPEVGWKWNNEARYSGRVLSVTATAFVQWIGNYIYNVPQLDPLTGMPEVRELLAGVFPVFRYRQVDALFYGGDVRLQATFWEQLRYTVSAQWVRGRNRRTAGYFPYIPSDRYAQELLWTLPYRLPHLRNISVGLNHLFVAKQTRFDPEADFLPDTPPAYHLLGAHLGADIPLSKGKLTLSVDGSNLLNLLYKEYTNRFRYYAHEKGRDVQFTLAYTFP